MPRVLRTTCLPAARITVSVLLRPSRSLEGLVRPCHCAQSVDLSVAVLTLRISRGLLPCDCAAPLIRSSRAQRKGARPRGRACARRPGTRPLHGRAVSFWTAFERGTSWGRWTAPSASRRTPFFSWHSTRTLRGETSRRRDALLRTYDTRAHGAIVVRVRVAPRAAEARARQLSPLFPRCDFASKSMAAGPSVV